MQEQMQKFNTAFGAITALIILLKQAVPMRCANQIPFS